jgi:RNA polymerase sigma-70 factor (ECF subfamily)
MKKNYVRAEKSALRPIGGFSIGQSTRRVHQQDANGILLIQISNRTALTVTHANIMSQKRRFFSYSKQRCRLDLDPKHLMIEAKSGNGKAFDALYNLYLTPVFRYLYARTWNRDTAEDISQTTFMKAYAGLSGWRNLGKDPLAYFYTIARNALTDYWHSEQHFAVLSTECDQIADTHISPEIMLTHSQPGEILKRALDNLTKDQCKVLIMRYFDALNYAEISKATGKSKDSIRQHHSRALKALRRIIKGRSAASNKLTIQN